MEALRRYGVAILVGALGYIAIWGGHTFVLDWAFLHQARLANEAAARPAPAPSPPPTK